MDAYGRFYASVLYPAWESGLRRRPTLRYQRRNEVLSDEAAAACNQYPCHAGERGSLTYDAMPITIRGCDRRQLSHD